METLETNAGNYEVGPCVIDDLNAADLARCIDLLAAGGAVDPESAAQHLPRSLVMVVVRKDGRIEGLGTIKPVRRNYAALTAQESKFPFDPDTPELGYIVVDPPHRDRGPSSEIVNLRRGLE